METTLYVTCNKYTVSLVTNPVPATFNYYVSSTGAMLTYPNPLWKSSITQCPFIYNLSVQVVLKDGTLMSYPWLYQNTTVQTPGWPLGSVAIQMTDPTIIGNTFKV
jgi:hypothetical protein